MKNKALGTIFLIVLIDLLGFGIILPLLPFIAEKFGGNPFEIGLLGATYSFFQLVSSPILGRLSDRFGRKKILIISQAGSAGAVSGGKYRLKIEAEIFADYEKTIKIIEQFSQKLGAVHYFSNITSAPLKLEEISPREKGTLEGSPLTEERLRDFTLTAEVAAK